MKKILLILCLLPSVALGAGKKWTYPESPKLDDELTNAYAAINAVANGTFKASSMTLQGLTVDSATVNSLLTASTATFTTITVSSLSVTNAALINATLNMGSHKITNVTAGTSSGDAVNFGQIHLLQTPVVARTTTQKTTTSSSFQTTSLSASITTTNASSKVLIIACGSIQINAGSVQMFSTITRGGVDLSGGSGYAIGRVSATPDNMGVCMVELDSIGAATSTYAVAIKNADNTSTIAWGIGETQVMILMEFL